MTQRAGLRLGLGTLLLSCAAAGGCSDGTGSPGASQSALTAQCVKADAPLPSDAWICPEPRTLACVDGTGGAATQTLYVRESTDGGKCAGQTLAVQVDSVGVGTHDVMVRDASGDLLCQSELTVTDTVAPLLTPKPLIKLWPPNHKFHDIRVEDCFTATDACEGPLKAEFVWASSDEPVDSIGDGHFAPDIQVSSCGAIALRAERQGPKEGRVYKLGVRVVDRAGNATTGVCSVIVDHDQRGVDGADSGEAYRISFDGKQGLPACDGEQPPLPPTNPPVTPPTTQQPPTNPPVTPPTTQQPPTTEPPVMQPPPAEPPSNIPG